MILEKETTAHTPPTALLIEDDEMIQRMYAKMLARAGLQVRTAHDGAQGLQILELETVDIILLDLGMPGLNGFDTLAELQKRPHLRQIPVIILTNTTVNDQKAIYAEIKGAGVEDILHKYETSLTELIACIRKHLPQYTDQSLTITS